MPDRDASNPDGDPSRRSFMLQSASAGAVLGFAPLLPAPALTALPPIPIAAKPVAFVWMGQIMVDPTGREQAYVPPTGFRPPSPGV